MAVRLCAYKHAFAITATYTFWDFIKDIQNATPRRILNIASLVGHMIAHGSLGINVLKTIDMHVTDDERIGALVRVVLTSALIGAPSKEAIGEVFGKAQSALRDGLMFALDVYVRPYEKGNEGLREGRRVAKAALRPDVFG